MNRQPWCDECGKVIDNYHKMVYGDDIQFALNKKKLKKTNNSFIRILFCLIDISIIPYYRLVFCCQKHKDKFAKDVGLLKRVNM